ncbi:MAG: Rab family GTPase [Marinilabiliaceae bacterium]
MLPLLALIPLIIGGTLVLKEIWDVLTEDTQENLRECKKIAVLGDRGSGKTTLWNGLRGMRTSGACSQTMGRQIIESFEINVHGRTVTIEKGSDIGGGDDNVRPYYSELLSGGRTVLFYLVSAVDLMTNQKQCSLVNVTRLRRCRGELGAGGSIILLLTHKDEFIKKYGKSSMEKVENLSHIFDESGCDGRILVELTNSDDIKQIKELIIG